MTTTTSRLAFLAVGALDQVAKLGATLAEIEVARAELLADLNAAIASKVETTPRAVHNNRLERAQQLVDRLTLPSALAAELWTAGVGRRGVRIDSRLVDISQVGERDDGKPFDLEAEIVSVNTKLAQLAAEVS